MEKERYIVLSGRQIKDTENNSQDFLSIKTICRKLNQQDARIKELEDENNFLGKRNEELMIDRRDFCLEKNDLFEENQQLKENLLKFLHRISDQNEEILHHKQTQNEKAIECLEKVKKYILNIPDKFGEIKTLPNGYSTYYVDRPTIICKIDNLIKELRDE